MKTTHKNPIVDFLRTYGPLAASDSIYDEHVLKSADENGVPPLDIGSKLLDLLVRNFGGSEPRNVILTGTAGDGKTWHCRKLFTELGGAVKEWKAAGGMVELTLPVGRKLVIVKDLSQFHEDSRQDEIFEGLVSSISGVDTSTVYLVAANDGQLLRFWRKHIDKGGAVIEIDAALRTMLEGGKVSHGRFSLDMHNLSRQQHDEVFDSLVAAITNHPKWDDCDGCSLLASQTCAIRRNRDLLAAAGRGSMRSRLGHLIKIAAANDMHLPMRHILVLIVNVLLGVSRRRTTMMTCGTAQLLAEDDQLHQSNPYDNVLGLNLKGGENREYLAFTVFENAGIGLETNNEIDTLLIDKQPEGLHSEHVASDTVHGAPLFEHLRVAYRRGACEDFGAFQKDIEAQRRRLFFVLPDKGKIDPWSLTVFRHGGEYIGFWDDLVAKRHAGHVKARLVIGLNRSYSGTMCDDSNVLWLTSPAANTQSRVGRILDQEFPVGDNAQGAVCFDFGSDGLTGRPKMVVRARTGFSDPFRDIAEHSLSPLLFEYLLRVEGGSLPGSFSRQCFEELRQFRLKIMAVLQNKGLAKRDDLGTMRVVRLGDDGRLKDESLDIVAMG